MPLSAAGLYGPLFCCLLVAVFTLYVYGMCDVFVSLLMCRFCQHTCLGFLGRTLPPAVMMTSTNGVFSSEVCQTLHKVKIQDWGSGMLDMVGPAMSKNASRILS